MRAFKIIAAMAVIGTVVFVYFKNDIIKFFEKLPALEQQAEKLVLAELEKQSFLPPPLRAAIEKPQTFLTVEGILEETNRERGLMGLPPLATNQKLNASALRKVQDMFQKQYFAHVSPTGISVSDLANAVYYEYILIGENLALGNFGNDKGLVNAWMESPGHRANILNSKYSEIGVAVMKGTFEGHTSWLAVQHFGTPLSACPAVNATLKAKITADEARLDRLNTTLAEKKEELDASEPKYGPKYNVKIDEYNILVREYNALFIELKKSIETYNAEVRAFNACAAA